MPPPPVTLKRVGLRRCDVLVDGAPAAVVYHDSGGGLYVGGLYIAWPGRDIGDSLPWDAADAVATVATVLGVALPDDAAATFDSLDAWR